MGRCAIGLVGCQPQAFFFVVQLCRFLREKIALPPSILAPFVSSGAQHLVEIRESLCFVGSVAVEFSQFNVTNGDPMDWFGILNTAGIVRSPSLCPRSEGSEGS